VDRRLVEEVLGVSKTVAWRILRKCRAEEGPGNTLICRREDFVEALRQMEANPEVQADVRRRNRVEDRLAQLARLAHTQRTKVAEDEEARELLATRFNRLPAGVDLRPGRLTIDFQGTADFLKKFGAVVFALQNEYESIAEFMDSPVPPQ